MAVDSLIKATVHEPVGNPAGPGLWKHKGWQLPAYIQHIANDLREKRGMPTSRAIATAIGAVKRWADGGGKVDANTRAAAQKAVTEWEGLKSAAGGTRAGKAALSELEDPIVSAIDFSEADFQLYSAQNLQGGFSPGTSNVTAEDYHKLLPMLRYYAKHAHPFQACYEDVKEEFGDNSERYAALIKDLIYHSTAWRNAEKAKDMEPVVLGEYADWDEDDYLALAELVTTMDEERINKIILASDTNIAKLQTIANAALEYIKVEKDSADRFEMKDLFRRVHALIAKDRADKALKTAPDPTMLSEGDTWMAEMFFDSASTGDAGDEAEDGVIWKTIMREGKWKLSPGPGQKPVAKPITVIAKGKSDPAKLVISMGELMKNYKDGAVEHVTIPTSHDNKVIENTGFIRGLRMKKDEAGRAVLQAAHDFTEPDVRQKASRGTIANTSAGVLFDYPRKEDGKTYRAVLEHVALTNRPWLSGMKPFGVAANDEGGVKTVMTFSEEVGDLSDDELEALMSDEPKGTETEDVTDGAAESEAEVELSEEEIAELSDEQRADLAAGTPKFGSPEWKAKYGKGKKAKATTKVNAAEETEEGESKEITLDDSKSPYGKVNYADPGYQKDGVKRYPLDTQGHCRAAWAYINKSHNAAAYSKGQLQKVKGRIRAALKQYGANVAMSDERLTKENLQVLLSQGVKSKTASEGGTEMPEETDYVERFGLSEEEIEEALKERETLKKDRKKSRVEAKLSEWTDAKKSPAVLVVAEAAMLEDDGSIAVELPKEDSEGKFNLSEDRKKYNGLTLSDVVERLVDASPTVNLDEAQVTDKMTTEGTGPNDEELTGDDGEVKLSAEVAAEARRLFLYEGYDEDKAIETAKKTIEKSKTE